MESSMVASYYGLRDKVANLKLEQRQQPKHEGPEGTTFVQEESARILELNLLHQQERKVSRCRQVNCEGRQHD
jgi:hypothetical protein